MCWERIRALVLARQPLEPRIPRDAQRHFVLGAQFLKLGHNAIAGRGVRLRGEGSGGFSAMEGAWRGGCSRPDVYGAFGVQAVHRRLHHVQFVLDAVARS